MSFPCLRRVISLWHQTIDLSPLLALILSSNTFWLPTLLSTWMGRVSCMTSTMASEKKGHVRPSSSCSIRILRGMLVRVSKQIYSFSISQKPSTKSITANFYSYSLTIFLWKLHHYGICWRELAWIQAFLGSRSQQVVIEVEEMESMPVTSCVPQGSVLCPTIFLNYINDLPDEVRSWVRLYADDTALCITIPVKCI